MTIKICRKEAKESRYWLRLIDTHHESEQETDRKYLLKEATELMNIFWRHIGQKQIMFRAFEHLNFGFVSNFVLRVSNLAIP